MPQYELPLVSIIIVNYNGRNCLSECLNSISQQTYPQELIEIIVVDNGSSDDSVDFVQRQFPCVQLLKNITNEGFAKPNNKAAKSAKGECIVLLNNDMVVKTTWLSEMVDMRQKSGAACIASTILNVEGTKIDFIIGSTDCYGYAHNFASGADIAFLNKIPDGQEMLYACGGAMLIDKKVYLELDGLDEDFCLYYEDTDLGWRIWLAGYRIVLAKNAVAFHKHSWTAKRLSAVSLGFFGCRNPLLMVYKNFDDHNCFSMLTGALFLRISRLAEKLRFEIPSDAYIFLPGNTRKPPFYHFRSIRYLYSFLRAVRKFPDIVIIFLASISFLYNMELFSKKRKKVQMSRKVEDSTIIRLMNFPQSYFIHEEYKTKTDHVFFNVFRENNRDTMG